ncbi:hypothetical protein L1987_61280 [Smallanthus sonchifolius]|uniref:Uncharacterized protein n=1 Tax=Smallanthus sonchifolius TaxID=185202 RepID=A0ACB9DAR6_9ASTR|nr:hypothetical protein L1987_61280 [Smallanthus sonchifolius]
MPWVGLYVSVASFICAFAMAVDAVQAIWKWKLWFPNRFFTLNASTITLIAIAMKLPVDLNLTDSCEGTKVSPKPCRITVHNNPGRIDHTKMSGMSFLVTMLANILPSLGLMDDKELLMNTVALGILLITIAVNIGIQLYTQVLFLFPETIPIYLFAFLWPFSVALTVSASRKKLEHRYNESRQLVSSHQEKMFSSKGLKNYVKKYWMMTETRNPQFVIACSPVSSAFGVICLYLAFRSGVLIVHIQTHMEHYYLDTSDYKWSLNIIFIVQSIGVVVGSIAPIFRCFTSIGHYNLSKEWSKNHLNVFRVEKNWIQRLQQWKRSHIHSHIPGRHCKIIFHNIKNTFLNLCITLHIAVLVICKIICLVPRTFLVLLSCCWYLFTSCLEKFREVPKASNINVSSEIEEYTMYVVQIEEEEKLSNRILRNTLHYITQLIIASEEKEPRNLMMLLEKSTGFNGVQELDNEKVQPLYPEETHNCWSLIVVTLTSIALALPNIANDHMKVLVTSMSEGLLIVRHIEECLYADGYTVKARKAARRVWTEIEIYSSWLQIDLQKKARKGKTSNEILRWLGDEAEKVMKEFKSSNKPSIDQSPYKFILASSMYRISQTLLLHCNKQENWWNDEELFERISTIIADVLSACFTNLPHVIKMKCHHHAIEKRGENIRNAAQLLGKSKKILKVLKARQLPNIDLDSRAYIDNWCVLLKSQIPNGSVSSHGIQQGSSSCNESLIVNIIE